MGRPTQVVPGSQSELSESNRSNSVRVISERRFGERGDPSGKIVGNMGLAISSPSFGRRETMVEDARGALEKNFNYMAMHMKHGTPMVAITAVRKFSMIIHQLDEKQLWHAFETLSEMMSDYERGNEVISAASQVIGRVEKELWMRLGLFAETGADLRASEEKRAAAFKAIEWLHPKLAMKAEGIELPSHITAQAEEEGKVGPGLPAINAAAVREAMGERAHRYSENIGAFASTIERKMAYAVLEVVFSEAAEGTPTYRAALKAFDSLDSPILSDILTNDIDSFQLKAGQNQLRRELDDLESLDACIRVEKP